MHCLCFDVYVYIILVSVCVFGRGGGVTKCSFFHVFRFLRNPKGRKSAWRVSLIYLCLTCDSIASLRSGVSCNKELQLRNKTLQHCLDSRGEQKMLCSLKKIFRESLVMVRGLTPVQWTKLDLTFLARIKI